jgi:hypothetical protein
MFLRVGTLLQLAGWSPVLDPPSGAQPGFELNGSLPPIATFDVSAQELSLKVLTIPDDAMVVVQSSAARLSGSVAKGVPYRLFGMTQVGAPGPQTAVISPLADAFSYAALQNFQIRARIVLEDGNFSDPVFCSGIAIA